MAQTFRERADAKAVPLVALDKAEFAAWLKRQDSSLRAWVAATDFKAEPGSWRMVAGTDGALDRVLVGADPAQAYANWSAVAAALPPGSYRIEGRLDARHATQAGLAWALAGYKFARYKSDAKAGPARALAWPENCDRAYVQHTAFATSMVRDLINTPTEDLGPAELAAAARDLARRHKAKFGVIVGDQLLAKNYPTVHAVGRASSRPPRLIDIVWGRPSDPKVTLCGKGVCFDTGGLDLKQASGMLRMKKDMGGGAHVLGLAHMIMAHKLPVRLRVLVPAVENSVSGNAIRPLDVVKTRKGITVEIGNTDAEGRLILCDALAEADREKPEVIVDYATLTGAARVALGPDLPALFCNDDGWAEAALAAGTREDDPMWRMPLWKPYRELLKSPVADINNVSDGAQGGAITAALYLNEFVSSTTPWLHIDLMAWNGRDKPGKPQGGEAQAMRAVYALIAERFGTRKPARGRRVSR